MELIRLQQTFLLQMYDKAEMDSAIVCLLEQYGVDPEDEGQYIKNDRGDMCHMWESTDNGWDVTIHTYKNEWDRWMIYIRFD